MDTCLYKCQSDSDSTQIYHVYPQSASNLQVVLESGIVCDKCNAYFAKLENYFVHYQPGASAKLLALKQTKKGKQPTFESNAGLATRTRTDEGLTLNIPFSDIRYEIKEDRSIVFNLAARGRPFDAAKISRVLGKIAIEFVSVQGPYPGLNLDAYSSEYDALRHYVRFGTGALKYVWFAYKDVRGEEGPPLIADFFDTDNQLKGALCLIRLPGIHYLFPLPPFLETATLHKPLHDWTFVETAGIHPTKDFDASFSLVPRKKDKDKREQESGDS